MAKKFLKMTIYDLENNVKHEEEHAVNSNALNRIHAPNLHGIALYYLKTRGKVECQCEDGSIIYELNDEETLKDGAVEVGLTKTTPKENEKEEVVNEQNQSQL